MQTFECGSPDDEEECKNRVDADKTDIMSCYCVGMHNNNNDNNNNNWVSVTKLYLLFLSGELCNDGTQMTSLIGEDGAASSAAVSFLALATGLLIALLTNVRH